MKRLQIMMDEDLYATLDRMALEEKTSKAALIRRFVRDAVGTEPTPENDPILAMAGAADIEGEWEPIDDVVYGL